MDYYELRDTNELDIPETINNPKSFSELSEIQKCFYDKTVLLTGGSGFIGSLLLESFLRSCVGIKRVYVLLRPKKGKTVEERLELLFQNEIFEKVLKKNPKARSIVKIMNGDITEPMCALSDECINVIKEEVNFIVHAAAGLRMDEPLKIAFHMNVRSTLHLLQIAEHTKCLKSFVYVSTAYSHAFRPVISEEFYKPGFNYQQLELLLDKLGDEEIAAITPKIVGPWGNTYTFTKAVCEDLVRSFGGKFPLAVVRPSIVIGCDKEPLEGWINNFYGATGVSLAASLGLMRVWYGDPAKIADIIPADKVVKAIIASMWYTIGTFKSDHQLVPIYNIVSSPKAPTTWDHYMGLVEKYAIEDKIVHSKSVGEYNFRLQPKRWLYFLQMYTMQLLSAIFIDLFLVLKGKKARLLNGYMKIHKFNMALGFYSKHEWVYQQKNMDNVWNSMSELDKLLFNFDLSTLDWNQYHIRTIRAIRVYILKDPMETLPQAREKY
uniref:Fatty acyl-CoA reductase n=1 Tax=Rhodnius prolixus TaxID=13249 RepID=T1HPR8_RHOPR